MIIQADIKGLEVVCVAFLSKDKVLYEELNNNVDIHQSNQDTFDLPSRLIAKVLKFRLIYGGSEYSFANDPDFTAVSTSTKYWKKVIDKYYQKYTGIAAWHHGILREVGKNSMLVSPLGRVYKWDLMKYGSYKIPDTQVKNYIVQGFGADVVAMARCSVFRRWRAAKMEGKLVNTVHDSICCDVPSKEVDKAIEMLYNVFSDLPQNINRIFQINFDLETKVEILVGQDMFNLTEWSGNS